MKAYRKKSMASLWQSLSVMINWMYVMAILTFAYIVFMPSVSDNTPHKKYDKEELAMLTKQRMIKVARERADDWDLVENGVYVKSGLIYDEHSKLVQTACTSCHSAKLIIQNRASRSGWMKMIKWMQKTQGLPDLGSDEVLILDYLSKNYAPKNVGRRPNLDMEQIQWYVLDLDNK